MRYDVGRPLRRRPAPTHNWADIAWFVAVGPWRSVTKRRAPGRHHRVPPGADLGQAEASRRAWQRHRDHRRRVSVSLIRSVHIHQERRSATMTSDAQHQAEEGTCALHRGWPAPRSRSRRGASRPVAHLRTAAPCGPGPGRLAWRSPSAAGSAPTSCGSTTRPT